MSKAQLKRSEAERKHKIALANLKIKADKERIKAAEREEPYPVSAKKPPSCDPWKSVGYFE